jgi:hypothetical protein
MSVRFGSVTTLPPTSRHRMLDKGGRSPCRKKSRKPSHKQSEEIASLSGSEKLLHFGSNLVVVGAKPHQMTLGLSDKELRLGDMVVRIGGVR